MKSPLKPNGKPDWNAIFTTANVGKLIEIPAIFRQAAYDAAHNRGYGIGTTGTVNPEIILLTPTGLIADKPKFAITPDDLREAKQRDGDIVRKLKEATENLAYWRRQREIRVLPEAKVQAGARVLLWQKEIRALEAKLQPAAV